MSMIISSALYFLTFIPLWIAILLFDVYSILISGSGIVTECITIVAIILTWIFCYAIISFKFSPKRRMEVKPYTIVSVKKNNNWGLWFLMLFIFPEFDFTRWQSMLLFLIYFILVGCYCIKHNLYMYNIHLGLRGYTFFECELEREDKSCVSKKVVISKKSLTMWKEEEVYCWRLNDNIFVEDIC